MAEEDKNSSPLDEGTEIIAHTAQTAYATTAAVTGQMWKLFRRRKSRTRQINKITFKIQKNRIQELKIRRW